jgi:hypothetical protein
LPLPVSAGQPLALVAHNEGHVQSWPVLTGGSASVPTLRGTHDQWWSAPYGYRQIRDQTDEAWSAAAAISTLAGRSRTERPPFSVFLYYQRVESFAVELLRWVGDSIHKVHAFLTQELFRIPVVTLITPGEARSYSSF